MKEVTHYQNKNSYDAEIKSMFFKKDTVHDLITKYIKKCLQVVVIGVDINCYDLDRGVRHSMKYGNFSIVDREVKSLKFRHTDFPGLRVPASLFAMVQSNNINGNNIT